MYSGETAPSGAEGDLHMKLSGKRTGYGRNSGKPNGTEEAISAKREESFRFTNGGALITGAPPFFLFYVPEIKSERIFVWKRRHRSMKPTFSQAER